MNTIPTVNLADFLSGDQDRKNNFVQSLGKAYQEVGFVAVQNHGINQQLVDDFYKAVEDFFALPESVKQQYEVPGLAGQRGFTSFGKEHAKNSRSRLLRNWGIINSSQYRIAIVNFFIKIMFI